MAIAIVGPMRKVSNLDAFEMCSLVASYKYFSIKCRDTRMPLPLRLSDYPHLLDDSSPPQRWLMSDWVRKDAPVFPHQQKGGFGGGRNVLFADTSVQFIRFRSPGAF